MLCKRAGGHGYFFRVYDESGAYIDYDLRHDDLEITIDPDTMAALYDLGDICVLDHSPEVLGLSSVESQFASE